MDKGYLVRFKNYALKMNYERANLVIKCTSLQKHQKS